MKVIAINASPRKNFSTAKLLESALGGAASAGAETKLVHLIDLDFKGCTSCFACHRKNNPQKYHCMYKDDLTPILREIEESDAVIIGSPIYIGDVTALARALQERLIFQYVSYNEMKKDTTMFNGKVNAGYIFVMNCPEVFAKEAHKYVFDNTMADLSKLGGTTECMMVNETYQFDDYSKYECAMFDVDERTRIRDEEFPKKLQEAFELGKRLALA